MRNKIVDAAEAVAIIRSGDTVASSGFVGVGTPDEIIKALERRFVQTGEPRDLSLVFAAAPGDGADRGLNRLAHPGLIKRLVGGHFGLVPKLARMAVDNHVEAYNLPLGCVSHLFREIAGRKAGLLSKVGLGTFVDPSKFPKDFLMPDKAGLAYINPKLFHDWFAQDVNPTRADVMAVVQKPFNLSIFTEKSGPPAWKQVPTWYLVSENDRMIPPAVEHMFAKQMNATTISLPASHASLESHPNEIAQLILNATRGSSSVGK